MPKRRILVIEDETDILDLVTLRLQKEGFEVLRASNGEMGIMSIQSDTPDIVLLDLMLPQIGGLEVLRRVRATRQTANLPVVIMSARGEESDIVIGLELGADDYVTKPFNMTVLVARINAVIRRCAANTGPMTEIIQVGPIEIDFDRYLASIDGETLSLTRTEFRLLSVLASARGRVLSRNQLIDKAIGSDAIVTDRTIDVHLTSLRNKLGKYRDMIETVRGVGYRMSGGESR